MKEENQKELNKCCQAKMLTATADEGTSCWICSECKNATDPLNQEKLNKYGEKWCILPTCENLAGHDGYYCEEHHSKYYFGKSEGGN